MRFAVLGSPVAHSKSPAMHAAAYRALGLPHTYEAIDCDEAGLERFVAELKRGEWGGFNVTVPHKLRALALADEIDASARGIAANTLARAASGAVVATNTDVPALVAELEALAPSREIFRGKTAVVLGTGGAARAAVAALGDLGVARVVVVCRDTAKKIEAPALELERIALGNDVPIKENTVAVIQATTCGMTGGPDGSVVANAIDWPHVPKSAVVLDVVYSPTETAFLRAAKDAGLVSANGLGMLARQGALAFERWLGIPAPLDAMLRAIGAEIPVK